MKNYLLKWLDAQGNVLAEGEHKFASILDAREYAQATQAEYIATGKLAIAGYEVWKRELVVQTLPAKTPLDEDLLPY